MGTPCAVPWPAVFGNDRPVEIEIGAGRGDVLLALATARPAHNFLAIEQRRGAADALAARVAETGLRNVRVLAGDARCIIARLVPPGSVAAYHVYFPDPWPKNRHRSRRLADPGFAHALAGTLAPGGAVHVATDLPALLRSLSAALAVAGLFPVPGARPDPARPRTKFERKYAQGGTHYACFAARGCAAVWRRD